MTQKLKFALDMVENISGKEENAGTSIFFFSHYVFKWLIFQGHLKSGSCGKGLTLHTSLKLCRLVKG